MTNDVQLQYSLITICAEETFLQDFSSNSEASALCRRQIVLQIWKRLRRDFFKQRSPVCSKPIRNKYISTYFTTTQHISC